jgi:hypothetical protein
VLSWCNSQFFCHQSLGWSLRTFSDRRRKTSQEYAEFTLRPARANSLRTIPLMSKKIPTMLLTLFFTCLTFLGLGEFGLSMYNSCFLPRMLV